MAKYHFVSTQQIGTVYSKTKADARDEFIQWSFQHLIDLKDRYPNKVVRSCMLRGSDTIIFTVDDVVIETWNLRATWGIMDGLRKLMRMK